MLVRELTQGEEPVLQALLESDSGYTERVTGYPPGPSDALSVLTSVLPGLEPGRKHVLGAWVGSDLVGVTDLLRGWPDEETVLVGLLLIDGTRQGQGLGRQLHEAVLDHVATWPEITRLRIGIVDTNREVAEPFWRALGYAPSGESKRYSYDRLESTTRIWTRPVRPGGAGGGCR
jgi:GNAT superfamily N-acetyltransferase